MSGAQARERVGSYGVTVILSLAILTVVFELWRAEPRVPLVYMHGSGARTATLVRSVIDTGSALRNPHLGAPFELDARDIPSADALHLLVIRVLSLFTGDAFLLTNVCYVLTFPAVAAASLYALRSFGVPTVVGIVVSLLFAFLPHHLHPARGFQRLFLSSYFAIPLVTTLLLRISSGLPVWRHTAGRNGRRRIDGRTVATILIAIAAGSTGIYYAFFAGFLVLVAGAIAQARGQRRSALASVALFGSIGVVSAAQLMPSVLSRLRNGENPSVTERTSGQSELYGLKIAQLLLPVDGHRLPALARLKADYNLDAPNVNENGSVTLGLVASAGFLFLLARAVVGVRRGRDDALAALAALNLAALLLGTLGGFGVLFALMASTLRAWNRVNVYVAFFSLFAVALLLGDAPRRFRNVLLFLLLLAGIADQTSGGFVPAYEDDQRTFHSDAEFVRRIEAALPTGAMVFQLPYVPFPVSTRKYDMGPYDHLRAYLHSRSLRWSFASIEGRGGDAWQREVAGRPREEMLRTLALADFAGVYVNRWGFRRGAESLAEEFTALAGKPAAVSGDAKLLFFDLTSFTRDLRARYSDAEWQELRAEALRQPLVFHWGDGCYRAEKTDDAEWRWCGRGGALTILNSEPEPRRVKLEMLLGTGYFEPAEVSVEGEGVSERFEASAVEQSVSLSVTVPRSGLVLKFRSNAERLRLPDPRELVFRVSNFRAEEIRGED